jgi:lipopolysaccharide export system permease protein
VAVTTRAQPATDAGLAFEITVMILSLLDRYIGRRILMSTLLVAGVLLAMFFFLELVEALHDYGKGSFGLPELITYVVLIQPGRIYEVLPVAALIGALMGLSTLAASSELVAMRAAGLSVARIIGSAVKVGLVLAVAGMAFGEYVVPYAEGKAQSDRARALSTAMKTRTGGLWIRDGSGFINIGEILPGGKLLNFSLYEFDILPEAVCKPSTPDVSCEPARLHTYIYAEKARLRDGMWRLTGVRISEISDTKVSTRRLETVTRATSLTPEVVDAFAIKPDSLSLASLWRYIAHLERHGQDVNRYRLAFWQKLLQPAAILVMALLATPFVFRLTRSGTLGKNLFIGVLLGLGFIAMNRSFGYLGLIYGIPPVVGAIAPLLLFSGLAVHLLRRMA